VPERPQHQGGEDGERRRSEPDTGPRCAGQRNGQGHEHSHRHGEEGSDTQASPDADEHAPAMVLLDEQLHVEPRPPPEVQADVPRPPPPVVDLERPGNARAADAIDDARQELLA
jgi:hypothetical protein